MKLIYRYCFLYSASAALFSCSNPSGKTYLEDNPTSGNVSISVDESYRPILEAEVDAFEAAYGDAKIRSNYKSEGEVMKDLMASDSCRFAVISRLLTAEETKYFESLALHPQVTKIAIDAVAIIINKENKNDSLTLEQLKDIFSGKTFIWKQLESKSANDTINVVFDSKTSGNARFIKEQFLNNEEVFPKNCYALNGNKEVIDYVSSHPNALGVIGVSWISDKDDTTAVHFMKNLNVVSVASKYSPDIFYKPYQAYVAQGAYPLTRDVYVIKREARAGLGTGFVAYIASDKGQRIILKAGMVPATMPVRLVEIK